MAVSSANRTALFIDGANLYSTTKALGFDIDYKRLLKEFQSHGTLVRAFYYAAVTEDQEFSSVRPLLDWLDYNGFTVVTKPTKEFVDANGHRKVKGNMDIVGRSCAATRCSGHGGLHDFHPASNDCRRASPSGGRVHRSDGFAVQNRPRSARAPNSARSQSAFNSLRPPADIFERRPDARELQGLTDS
jgi:hypothetical protein